MSGPVRERLDETIDRVAAMLTAVPADPGFTERLAPRLVDRGHGSRTGWLMTAAAAAAAIVIAIVFSNGRDERASAPQEAMVTGSPTAPALVERGTAATAQVPTVEPPSAPRDQAVARSEDLEEPRPPSIAALPAPDGIGVDTLHLEALAVMPVDVGEIDLASLEVRQIGGFEESKE